MAEPFRRVLYDEFRSVRLVVQDANGVAVDTQHTKRWSTGDGEKSPDLADLNALYSRYDNLPAFVTFDRGATFVALDSYDDYVEKTKTALRSATVKP